jgi:plasmid stabilization system protein ParE
VTAVVLRLAAEQDVKEARLWYHGQQPKLGKEFVDELRRAMRRIGERPLQFPEIAARVRRTLLHRFPYAVYFVLRGGQAIVVAVLHQRRRPATWKRRARDEKP